VIFFMDNVVEAPRFVPLEVYVTPLRARVTNVQIESPLWFEPFVFQKAQVSQQLDFVDILLYICWSV